MANDWSAVTPKLLAQGLLALRGKCVMPRLVNTDYEVEAKKQGESIDVPIPSAVATKDVVPGATPPSTDDSAPTSINIPLSEWKESAFYLTDKDLRQVMAGTIPMQASEAIASLAETINGYIFGLYKKVPTIGGTPGTTPFSDGKTTDANQTRMRLNVQKAPLSDRRFVLDPEAEASAAELRAFQDVSFSGDPTTIQTGQIKNKIGFDWYMDQGVPIHTAGTITTGLIAKAATAQAVGLSTIVCTTAASTGACALVEGDIIAIAGHTQTYALTEDATQASAGADVSLKIHPQLQQALTGSEAITVKASHTVNLAFHRDAFAFATRPLEDDAKGFGSVVMSEVDPVSGLALRLEISREHKRLRFAYDALYGGALTRWQMATRLAG